MQDYRGKTQRKKSQVLTPRETHNYCKDIEFRILKLSFYKIVLLGETGTK